MKKYIYILAVISACLITFWSIKMSNQPTYSFNDIQEVLLETYLSLTDESCLVASQHMVSNLSNKGIGDVRFLQFFADPLNPYETHVSVEVKIPGYGWVYVDPTFNGYYTSAETGKLLSVYQIRSLVKHNQLHSLIWHQNKGVVKDRYDITQYYINPLYLTRGLIYLRGDHNYQVVGDWAIPFDKKGTIFEAYNKIISIRDPKYVDSNIKSVSNYEIDGFKWGLDKGFEDPIPLKLNSGKDVEFELSEAGHYLIELSLVDINEDIQLTIHLKSQTLTFPIKINDEPDQYFVSKIFYSSNDLITISMDGNNLQTNAYIRKVTNDIKDKIKVVSSS